MPSSRPSQNLEEQSPAFHQFVVVALVVTVPHPMHALWDSHYKRRAGPYGAVRLGTKEAEVVSLLMDIFRSARSLNSS